MMDVSFKFNLTIEIQTDRSKCKLEILNDTIADDSIYATNCTFSGSH